MCTLLLKQQLSYHLSQVESDFPIISNLRLQKNARKVEADWLYLLSYISSPWLD